MPTYEKGNKYITKFMVSGVRHSRMTDTRAEGEAWELAARAALKLGKPLPEPEVKRVRAEGGALNSVASVHSRTGAAANDGRRNADR